MMNLALLEIPSTAIDFQHNYASLLFLCSQIYDINTWPPEVKVTWRGKTKWKRNRSQVKSSLKHVRCQN